VACQGTASAKPRWLCSRTQGAPARQKTRLTRPDCPQWGLSSAMTVSVAPTSATYGAVCWVFKGYDE
jgi:hypothetical protein